MSVHISSLTYVMNTPAELLEDRTSFCIFALLPVQRSACVHGHTGHVLARIYRLPLCMHLPQTIVLQSCALYPQLLYNTHEQSLLSKHVHSTDLCQY